MNIKVEDDFDEEFYEMVLPEVKGYYEGSQYSKREKYHNKNNKKICIRL